MLSLSVNMDLVVRSFDHCYNTTLGVREGRGERITTMICLVSTSQVLRSNESNLNDGPVSDSAYIFENDGGLSTF